MFRLAVGFGTLVAKWPEFERIGKGFESVILFPMTGGVIFGCQLGEECSGFIGTDEKFLSEEIQKKILR